MEYESLANNQIYAHCNQTPVTTNRFLVVMTEFSTTLSIIMSYSIRVSCLTQI